MSNLPRTDIADLPTEERGVAEALIATLGDDLAALAWQGSWERGEETEASDHDLFLAMRHLDTEILGRIGDVLDGRRGWSVFIKTAAELRQYPAHARLQFHHGMVLLHGDFEQPPLQREHVLAEIRALAIDIQHESRFRLVHSTRSESSGAEAEYAAKHHAALLYYWTKTAVLAMKARELLDSRDYPLTRAELRQRTSDADELAIIDVVERWSEVKTAYERDFRPLAHLLDRFVRRLVSELPAE